MIVMKKIIQYFVRIMFALCVAAGIGLYAPGVIHAEELFVMDDSDMIGQGGYIYYISSSQDDLLDEIWRMKVATGETSMVVSEPGGILKMIVCGELLYYTTANEESQWEIRSCRLNGADQEIVCEGVICHVDNENIYYMRHLKPTKTRLYARNLKTGKKTVIRTGKEGQTLALAGTIGNDMYYYLHDTKTDKLYLYRLNNATNKLIRVASEKRVADGTGGLLVSDVKQIDGELYYNFGSYEGSGGFWYGTIRRLTVDGKKKTVVGSAESDRIIAGRKEIYFTSTKGNYYKYDLKTAKKTKYSLKFEKDINYSVLGDKTYMADTSDAKQIQIFRFNSGTDREVLARFTSIPFKQRSNISYAVKMKQVGVYFAVCVTGTDYSKPEYGWRGKTDSINWYIVNTSGKVIGSF